MSLLASIAGAASVIVVSFGIGLMFNKDDGDPDADTWMTGAASVIVVGFGIGLMLYKDDGDPDDYTWMTVGRIILGAGLSSGINSFQQVKSRREFSYFEWLRAAGFRALNGTVATLCGEGGGLAAEIVSGVLSESMSESVSDILSKLYYGQDVTVIGVCMTALIGGAVGLVGAIVEQIVEKLVEKLVSLVDVEVPILERIAVSMVAGCVKGVLSTLIGNKVERGKITKHEFIDDMMIEEPSLREEDAKKLWTLLCDDGIIKQETAQDHLSDSLEFPERLKQYQKSVKENIAYSLTYSIWRGADKAAFRRALVRGATAGVASGARWYKRRQRQERVWVA